MPHLALAVERRVVRLAGYDGSSSQALVALAASSARVAGPETLLERLNDPRTRFLPCEIDGETSLVNLDWIAYLETTGTSAPDLLAADRRGAAAARVELDLVSGESLEGELRFDPAPGRERALDALGRGSERFLLLATTPNLVYVNTAAVLRVRDEGSAGRD